MALGPLGFRVLISGVRGPLLLWAIIMVTLIITPLITTHEPPSRGSVSHMSHV